MVDTNGYPTTRELNKIKKWDYHDFVGLMEYVEHLWRYSDCGYWRRRGRTYRISTGGWSGNESIIAALIANRMFWAMCWCRSARGGHYVFHVAGPF